MRHFKVIHIATANSVSVSFDSPVTYEIITTRHNYVSYKKFNLVVLVGRQGLGLPWGHPHTIPVDQDSQRVLAALVHHRALGLLLDHMVQEVHISPWFLFLLYSLKMANKR